MNRSPRLRAACLGLIATAALFAGCDSKPSTAPVVPPLSRVEVTPARDTIRVGEVAQFSATAYDTLGAPVTGVPFQWTSADPGVFTVNGYGRVQGVGEGTGALIVEAGSRRDTAWVTAFPDTGWFQQPSGTTLGLNAVFFQANGRSGVAVGEGGTVVRTVDAGASWQRPPSGTSFSLNGVWFTSALEGWAVGNAGTILHTMDGGQGWTRLTNVGVGDALFGVRFATPDTGWVVGGTGLVLRTFDRGASWQSFRVPTAFALHGVAFSGTRDGWVVGAGGVIAGTHDRGVSWFLLPSLTTQGLEAVWRRGEPAAWAVGSQGVAPRTIAGADSTIWELRNAGQSRQLYGICYPTDQIGFAVGYDATLGGAVLRTDDGGLTWQAQPSRTAFRLNDVFFVDELHGWAVGDGGVILHTARGGGD
jgi:photosystem II stability/assembly factor-like uncharacterized protein